MFRVGNKGQEEWEFDIFIYSIVLGLYLELKKPSLWLHSDALVVNPLYTVNN